MVNSPSFQCHQIVYLEHEGEKLYAEVIQVVPERGLCWARPLALLKAAKLTPLSDAIATKYSETCWNLTDWNLQDMRQASDILLPIICFQAALDIEVLPLIAEIYGNDDPPNGIEGNHAAQEQLLQFFQKLCQAAPAKLQCP